MRSTRSFDAPEFRRGMRLLGWSTADVRGMAQYGSTWFVAEARRGGRVLRGERSTEAAAWAEVGWEALQGGDATPGGLGGQAMARDG